jgi:hypothetical protein
VGPRLVEAQYFLPHPEEIPDRCLIVNGDVQIAACDAHIRMSSGISDLGQRSSAGQGMADKRVAAVMDRAEPAEGFRLAVS